MQSICRGHYEHLEYITQEGEIIKNLNKGEFYKYLGINQSNHIQHSIIKENLEKQFYLRIKSLLKSKLNGNNLINTYAVPLLTYSFGVIKWSKTNLQNINIKTGNGKLGTAVKNREKYTRYLERRDYRPPPEYKYR
jgi:hypothetical protein